MSIEELKKELKRIEKKQGILYDIEYEIKKKIASETCPYKVGDILKNERGKKGKVSKVLIGNYGEDWNIRIRMIKKNGDLFSSETRFYNFDGWKKVR